MNHCALAPLISVVTPTYNRANSVQRAIRSVLNEPGDYFEMIVGDDGSPDHTPEVVRPFLGDPRLRYYRNGVNLGMRENMFKIAREAKGHYIFVLTDDDWLLPGALEKVVRVVCEHPEVGYVLSHLPTVDERNGRIVGMHCTYRMSRLVSPSIENMAHVAGSAWVLSRQVLRRDLVDWSTWEKFKDNIFFPIIVAGRLMLKAPCYYLAEPLVMHTWFNKVFWHAFGRNQLEIDFNLNVDRYRCMRAILHDYEMTPQVRTVIRQWEFETFKLYLHAEESGFFDLIKGLGLQPAMDRLREGFDIGSLECLELALFFARLPLRRAWVGVKSVAKRLSPRLFYRLKSLKDGISA